MAQALQKSLSGANVFHSITILGGSKSRTGRPAQKRYSTHLAPEYDVDTTIAAA